MAIAITSEHQDLADSVRSLLARAVPSELLHAQMDEAADETVNPPAYWRAAAEQGLAGVHLPEELGGQGFGILELAVVLDTFRRRPHLPSLCVRKHKRPSGVRWLFIPVIEHGSSPRATKR